MPIIKSSNTICHLRKTLSFVILTAHFFGNVNPGNAQVQISSSKVTVIHDAATEAIPPKPSALKQIPIARLDIEGDSRFERPLSSYLVQLFKRAERPRLTEGDNFDFVIRTIIITPPELNILKSSGGRFNALGAAKSIGAFFGGPKLQQIPENLNLDNTNMIVEAHCAVEIRLLNSRKEIIAQESAQVIRTNNLKELTIELNGFREGNSSDSVGNFLQNLTRNSVQQALVNLTAYHATTNLLVSADKYFMELTNNPVTSAVAKGSAISEEFQLSRAVSSAASLVTPPSNSEVVWLTPAQAAIKLQLSEADVIAALEKGELKGKKIGPTWRMLKKDLE